MAPKSPSKQEFAKEQPDPSAPDGEFISAAQEAPIRPVFLPILNFGKSKTAKGFYEVEFLQPVPREIEVEDKQQDPIERDSKGKPVRFPTAVRWCIDVLVHKLDGFNDVKPGEKACVIFRKPEMKDGKKKYHSLTQGILNVDKVHRAEDPTAGLRGVKVKIETRPYPHESWGDTRSYDVHDLGRIASKPAAGEGADFGLPAEPGS